MRGMRWGAAGLLGCVGLLMTGGNAAVGAETGKAKVRETGKAEVRETGKAEVRETEFALPECVLSGPVTVELGQLPQLTVAIKNPGRSEILLVRNPLSGGGRIRFPQYEFEIDGVQPPPPVRRVACLAPTAPLTVEHFVRVRPGETFDPFGLSDAFPPAKLIRTPFAVPGEYRIRFRYSTAERDPAYWIPERDRDGQRNSTVEGMIGQVPKFEVRSNEIKVLVIDPSR